MVATLSLPQCVKHCAPTPAHPSLSPLRPLLLPVHLSCRRTVGLSPRHSGQYQRPFGFVVSPTQLKWYHSIGQSSLSQPIISPYDTCWHEQYVGSSGSIASSCGERAPSFCFLVFLFFFFFGLSLSSWKSNHHNDDWRELKELFSSHP